MRETLLKRLAQIGNCLLNVAALVVRELARLLLRDRKTTAGGVTFALAYLAARHGVVVPEAAQPYVIAFAFIVLGALAKDSQSRGQRQ